LPVRREALDGLDRGTVGLHREQEARPDRRAVEADRVGAANTVLAADVGAGEPERVAQEVGEQEARLDLLAVHPAVDGHLDRDHAATARASARATARSTSNATSR